MSAIETDLALAKGLIRKNLEDRELSLDLGRTGLTNLDLVSELHKCGHLETLILSNSWEEYIDGEWKRQESQNEGPPNRIDGLTGFIAKLRNLKILVCGGSATDPWPISDLSPIGKLKQLQTLNLPNNSIRDVGTIKGMSSLQVLLLDQNHITDPALLSNLTRLHTLALNQNRIKNISALSSLKNLKNLYLRENQIDDISPLSKLVHLQILELDKNRISDLSPLSSISEMRKLHFDSNEISELSPLTELVHIGVLRGARNQIDDLLPLSKLANLEIIDLSGNRISNLAPLSSLKKLKELHIGVNQIDDTEQLRHLPVSLKSLTLDRNPFEKKAGLHLYAEEDHLSIIQEYLRRQKEDAKIDVHLPTKVLLLGNHQCGKSSLCHYLLNNNLQYDGASTHGLKIESYYQTETEDKQLPDAIIYDFGGQDYYHGIYRIFLSVEAVYILLWRDKFNRNRPRTSSDGLITRDFDVAYWLGQRQHFERTAPASGDDESSGPVFLVQTWADADPRSAHNSDHARSKIHEEFFVSLAKGEQPEVRKQALVYLKAMFDDQIDRKQVIREPVWYKDFLKYIIDFRKKGVRTAHKPVNVKKELLPQYGLNIPEAERFASLKETLIQFHRHGLILYYPDIAANDAWLDPAAFAKYVHDRVLKKTDMLEKRGQVAEKDLKGHGRKLLNLLEKQKVIFKHEKQEGAAKTIEYIIPNYLPRVEDDLPEYGLFTFGLGDPVFTLKFENFIPMGLINQLICWFGQSTKNQKFWRNQLLFTLDDQSKVFIRLDFERLEIKIHITPLPNQTNDQTKYIRYLFYCIMAAYWDLKLEGLDQYVGSRSYKLCFEDKDYRPEDLYISLNGKHFVQYTVLLKHESDKRKIQARHLQKNGKLSWRSNDIAVHPFEPFADKSFTKIKKVFISYSHDDIEFRNAVHQYLINLQREGTVEIWHDELINTGEDWNEQILSALQEADLVILLVSQSFIASTYVNEVEMKAALSNMGSGKTIFPVLIKNCDWKKWRIYPDNVDPEKIGGENMGTAMGSFQFFPFDEQNHPKPINRWEYPEDAWTQLADKIRALS